MKANELMIGDYVMIDEPDQYSGCKCKVMSLQFHQEEDGFYLEVFISGKRGITTKDVFNEDLRPIPITSEFLKKNFVKKTFYGIFDDYYDFEIREINDGTFIASYHSCEMNLPDEQVIISYVHQLQHFLIHCGIEKRIEVYD